MYAARTLSFVLLTVLLSSCTGIRMSEDPADYEKAARRLEAQILVDPGDAEAHRDLGIIYLRTNRLPQAAERLEEAFAQGAEDPKTLLHLGLATEAMGRRQTALRVFERYVDVPRLSPYRRLMEGRYRVLSRDLVREEMQQQVLRESEIAGETSPRILAVVPFNYQGSDTRFAPLGRGLAEMLTVDLARVPDLQLVERVRLQALLDELELGQTGAVDPSTAPRMGRLLGAGRLVGGNYNVLSGTTVNIDAAIVAVEDAELPTVESRSASLRELFRLQKDVAFALIEDLGYTLTPEQREEIDREPTRSMQAFLAYSRGLQEEDAGNFDAAARHFGRAHRLDPGFDAAAERFEAAESMRDAGGTTRDLVVAASGVDAVGDEALNLVELRVEKLGENIGANLVPGQDSRKPFAEAAAAGATRLPDPPPPPARIQ